MSLNAKDVDEILRLVDRAGFAEFKLRLGDLSVEVIKQGARPVEAQPRPAVAVEPKSAPPIREAAPVPSPAPAVSAPKTIVPEGWHAVRAPMIGTFYRAPSPGAKPFIEVGAKVAANDTVCLVEVMKLFNSVSAGFEGTVAEILVQDATPVSRDEIIVLIKPSA